MFNEQENEWGALDNNFILSVTIEHFVLSKILLRFIAIIIVNGQSLLKEVGLMWQRSE